MSNIVKNDINHQDHKGQTALMMACKDADLNSVQQILELNPDVNLNNNFGQSALYYVAAGTKRNDTLFQIYQRFPDRVKIINLLHAQGVDINHRDDKGNTALMGGVFYYPILDCLLKLGAKAHYRNHKKESALFYACQSFKNTAVERLCDSDNSWMHIQRCLIEIKNVSSSNILLAKKILEKMKFDLPKIELKNKLNNNLKQKEQLKLLKI